MPGRRGTPSMDSDSLSKKKNNLKFNVYYDNISVIFVF